MWISSVISSGAAPRRTLASSRGPILAGGRAADRADAPPDSAFAGLRRRPREACINILKIGKSECHKSAQF
jgi:hypothetical protein